MADAKIRLYADRRCPWAHRVYIALAELGVPYEEEIIDLSVPRTPEYLAINPRGLVPALSYNGNIVTESGIIAQFLADAYPDLNLAPPSSTSIDGALLRARLAYFADTWGSKVTPHYHKMLFFAKKDEEAAAAAEELRNALVKEIEPLLLADANADHPFFGGSEKLTIAEVLVAPFVLRLFALAEHGVIKAEVIKDLPALAPNFYKWAQKVIVHPSVTSVFDVKLNVDATKARIARIRTKGS